MIDAVLPTYNRAPLAFERGEGAWAITADGSRYLDLGAGIAVNSLGHANPDLVAALTAQATSTQSPASRASRGTGSVAEAAALAAAGPGARLLSPRVISADGRATCALAEGAAG